MVLGAASRTADRVDVKLYLLESQPVENILGKTYYLNVGSRRRASGHFKSELVKFT